MARRKAAAAEHEDDPLEDYDERYLECRSINHPWRVTGFYHDPWGGIVRHLRCGRCGTTRRDLWTASGQRVNNHYSYAEGYQIHGSGGVSRGDVRVATLQRVHVFGSEDEMLQTVFGRGEK